jgi:hypothetical protein
MQTLLTRTKGRPKDRWWDSVRGDLKIVGVLDWKKFVLDRKYWQGILEQAKAHPGWGARLTFQVHPMALYLHSPHTLMA